MNSKVKIFNDGLSVARAVADEFITLSNQAANLNQTFNVAFSGGSTPGLFFESLATDPYVKAIPWKLVHLYWVDERCVIPEDPDSNFGVVNRTLLNHIEIPQANIHRIHGEAEVKAEVIRYSQEIRAHLSVDQNSFPVFDWILLGLGTDGHTASLFPKTASLLEKRAICTFAIHPQTRQRRISLTLPTINAGEKVSFLVTGKEKRRVVDEIVNQKEGFLRYPAALIKPNGGQLDWYLDQSAAGGE